MARKRASLKDKGAETLGLNPKKGKGIDVLFGGPSAPEEEETSAESEDTDAAAPPVDDTFIDETNDLSGLLENPVAAPAPTTPSVSDSLPVNEADDEEADIVTSEINGDDLGLPVALDGPPPDLELAMPTAAEVSAPLPEMPAAAEVPPAMSLESLPAAEPVAVSPPPEELPPAAEVAPVPPPETLAPASEPVPAPLPEQPAPAVESAPVSPPQVVPTPPADEPAINDDLAGLGALNGDTTIDNNDDLSGLANDVAEPPLEPANERTQYIPSNLPPGRPPETAAPLPTPTTVPTIEPDQPVPRPTPTSSTTTNTQPASPRPAMGTPPSTATGAPSLSMPRAKIESVEGFITEAMEVKEENILPEDSKMLGEVDNIIGLKEEEKVDYDEIMTRKVTRYVGPERRQKLDEEIERLYGEVAEELSVNKEDSEFALKVLSQAQDIVFEDTRQYDEAFYLVSVVKTMIARKRNLRRWSYTWGTFVFMYALIWLGFFIAGYLLYDQIGTQIGDTSDNIDAIRGAWFAALAGGIGGVIGILYSLYWHVAMKQDFDRQYVMYYLVQPVMGFVLGAVVYFIIGSGFLVINFALPDSSDPGAVLSSPTIIAIQVVLGWAAGFRQRFVFEMVDKIVQRVSPKEDGDESKKPESLVPEEERQRIQARIDEKAMAVPPPADNETKPVPAKTSTT